jgi:ABC-type polysaccharide/polyol phosphate transport system ATPase subunit
VEERCDRAALLVGGRIVSIGAAKDVVRDYRDLLGQNRTPLTPYVDA